MATEAQSREETPAAAKKSLNQTQPVAAKGKPPGKAAAAAAPTEGGGDSSSTVTLEEAEAKLLNLGVPASVMSGLNENGWKEKQKAIQELSEFIFDSPEYFADSTEHLVRVMKARFKDWKESNLNLNKEFFSLLLALAKNDSINFSRRAFWLLAPYIVDRISDTKFTESCNLIVFAAAETLGPKSIVLILLNVVNDPKAKPNPKTTEFICGLLVKVIEEASAKFLPIKETIEFLKGALSSTNASVRTAATSLAKSLYLHIGDALTNYLNDINPQLLKTLQAEFDKLTPLRENEKVCKLAFRGEAQTEFASSDKGGNPLDQLPRADISKDADKLLKKLSDADWKVRKDGLDNLEALIQANGNRIQPKGLDDLVAMLKSRLNDNNKGLARSVIIFMGKFAVALGPGAKNYFRTLLPPLISNLSDKTTHIRSESQTALEKWAAAIGADQVVNLVGPSLTNESPEMRTEICNLILKNIDVLPKCDTKAFVSPILAALLDKQKEIRLLTEQILEKVIALTGQAVFLAAIKDFKPALAGQLKAIVEKCSTPSEGAGQSDQMSATKTMKKGTEQTTSLKTDLNRPKTAAPTVPDQANIRGGSAVAPINEPVQRSISGPSVSQSVDFKGQPIQSIAQVGNAGFAPIQPPPGPVARLAPPANFGGKLLIVTNMKGKRVEAEGIRPWLPDTIVDELVARLMQDIQMSFAPNLIELLFSHESRKHREAIGLLRKALSAEFTSTIDNLDLIVRWLHVRLLESSNAQLVRDGLDYVSALLTAADNCKLPLQEFDVLLAVPLLVHKLGEGQISLRPLAASIVNGIAKAIPPERVTAILIALASTHERAAAVESLDLLLQVVPGATPDFFDPNGVVKILQLAQRPDEAVKAKALAVLSELYKKWNDNFYRLLVQLNVQQPLLQLITTFRAPQGDNLAQQNRGAGVPVPVTSITLL